MKKLRMEDYLNEWGEKLPRYGSVITKVVETKSDIELTVLDWQNVVCDPVSFESARPWLKSSPSARQNCA